MQFTNKEGCECSSWSRENARSVLTTNPGLPYIMYGLWLCISTWWSSWNTKLE